MAATYLISVIGRLQGTHKFFVHAAFMSTYLAEVFSFKIKIKITIFKPLKLVYTI
jgi:hypothetical protein